MREYVPRGDFVSVMFPLGWKTMASRSSVLDVRVLDFVYLVLLRMALGDLTSSDHHVDEILRPV